MKFTWAKGYKAVSQEDSQPNLSSLNDEELLDSFKTINWCSTSISQRVAVIQEMEDRNAVQQGRKPAKIVSSSNADAYGSFSDDRNEIYINVNDFSSYEVLDTYIHESNHAYQSYCVENGSAYDESALIMMAAEVARDQNGNLYNYSSCSPYYDAQYTELDSNIKAVVKLMSEKERFFEDVEYANYVSERDDHFKNVNTSIENCQESIAHFKKEQAHSAYQQGILSEEQYLTLCESIDSDTLYSPIDAKSHTVGDELSNLNAELQQNMVYSGCENGSENEISDDNSISF